MTDHTDTLIATQAQLIQTSTALITSQAQTIVAYRLVIDNQAKEVAALRQELERLRAEQTVGRMATAANGVQA
jgi:hypothetical protein